MDYANMLSAEGFHPGEQNVMRGQFFTVASQEWADDKGRRVFGEGVSRRNRMDSQDQARGTTIAKGRAMKSAWIQVNAMIEARNLARRYASLAAIDDISKSEKERRMIARKLARLKKRRIHLLIGG